MKYIFCIDLDGTCKTDVDDDIPDSFNPLKVHLTFSYSFLKRPHVDEFLKAAKKKGELWLTTAAGGNYAEKCLSALNIREYFSYIVPKEKMQRSDFPNSPGKLIWIDNDADALKAKISTLPQLKQLQPMETWIVETFYHNMPNDKVMLELIQEVKNLP